MNDHPIRLIVNDDMVRSRVTVFFRLLLALPHLIWLALWGIFNAILVLINWVATLITGTPPQGIHNLIARYARYATHVFAYLMLAANPFPGFLGERGSYPIDLEVAPPARQNRWVTFFRGILAFPAGLIAFTLFSYSLSYSIGLADRAGLLGWWASLFRARMPRGLRDCVAYGISYAAQYYAYVFMLTDRYPNSDPVAALGSRPQEHPVQITVSDDLIRSRLTVFFRLLLFVPHYIWLALWGIAALVALVVNWFATLITGRSPAPLHRFLSAYLRQQAHVLAFLLLVANPFPGFSGAPGSYPVDLQIAPPQKQNRWRTFFRFLLAYPALLIGGGFSLLAFTAALLGWWVALFTARMPVGLRNAGALALRYQAQTNAYVYLLTERYPFSSPADLPLAAPAPPPMPVAPMPA